MRELLVILVAFSLLGAGCVGPVEDLTDSDEGDDSQAEPQGGAEDNETNESENESGENESSGNESSNETRGNESNQTAGNETMRNDTEEDDDTQWTYDNRTGTVEGTNAIVTQASETEDWDVANGTHDLVLNVSAEGGELDLCIRSPDANESDECTDEVSTEDGNATWAASSPPGGQWSVEMTASGLGQQSVDYELVIAQRVPANDVSEE